MNYIRHLTGFFEKVANDKLLNPTHVSLYMALFQFWNCNRFKNPISISRDEVMRISKISSKATYHKCLKNLHALSYIKYEPSYNPFRGSHVYLFNFADDLKPMTKTEKSAGSNFKPVIEQVLNKSQTSIETGSEQVNEQAVVPSINNTNISNNENIPNSSNLPEPEKKIEEENLDFLEYPDPKEKKLREKKKIPPPAGPPKFEEVLQYFSQQNFPESEAHKFFNYFKSIGWLVGGKIPMLDWHSAANNWILNAPKFTHHENHPQSKHLTTSPEKDYAEPL